MATFTGTKSRAERIVGRGKKVDVLPLRLPRGTSRPTKDAGRPNTDEELAFVLRVPVAESLVHLIKRRHFSNRGSHVDHCRYCWKRRGQKIDIEFDNRTHMYTGTRSGHRVVGQLPQIAADAGDTHVVALRAVADELPHVFKNARAQSRHIGNILLHPLA